MSMLTCLAWSSCQVKLPVNLNLNILHRDWQLSAALLHCLVCWFSGHRCGQDKGELRSQLHSALTTAEVARDLKNGKSTKIVRCHMASCHISSGSLPQTSWQRFSPTTREVLHYLHEWLQPYLWLFRQVSWEATNDSGAVLIAGVTVSISVKFSEKDPSKSQQRWNGKYVK